MRTLGLLLVIGAVGYYALMNPAVVSQLTKTTPAPASPQSDPQETKESKTEEVQGENGDHLFEGLTG
jgi:uncharacterized membrane protein YebE (DUF533 family)